jgi:preflagellin peptidase FlaK
MMNVDWLLVLNIFRIIFTIIILFYASFQDVKTRTIPNPTWILLGFIGISLIECQLMFELGMLAFTYLLAIIPLTILFMSFLICDNIIDFEKKEFNDSWVFLITLAGFAFFYLFLFGPDITSSDGDVSKIQIFLPVILLLLYFILIQLVLNYLEARAYSSYKKILEIKKKKLKKNKKLKNIELEQVTTNATTENDETNVDYRYSWTLFFGLLSATIIMFIMTDIIEINIVRMIGRALLIAIPVLLILLYFKYSSEAKNYNKSDSEQDIEDDIEISIDELKFKPPNKYLIQSLFASLIFFGFLVIFYYSMIEVLSNTIVKLFILTIWLLIFFSFYNLGLPRGGADTKALMALLLVFPIYPILDYLTIQYPFFDLIEDFAIISQIFPFAFTVLINGAFIVLFYIIILIVYNISRHDLKFPHTMLGYKLPITEVRKRFVWLMERMVDGKRKLIPFPGGEEDFDLKSELQLLQKAEIKSVWVTPKIPFIIPMTIGLIITIIIGNIMFVIIGLLT